MMHEDVNTKMEEVGKLRNTLLIVEKRHEDTNNDVRENGEQMRALFKKNYQYMERKSDEVQA